MTFDLDPSLSILSAHQENIRINLQKCKAFGIQNPYLNMFEYSFQHWFRFIEMQQSNCVSRFYLDELLQNDDLVMEKRAKIQSKPRRITIGPTCPVCNAKEPARGMIRHDFNME